MFCNPSVEWLQFFGLPWTSSLVTWLTLPLGGLDLAWAHAITWLTFSGVSDGP